METLSLAEFNRNQTEVTDRLARNGKPLGLTRNGRTVAVLVNPDTYERQTSFKAETERREMETYAALLEGYQDVQMGKVISLDEADKRIRAHKGW